MNKNNVIQMSDRSDKESHEKFMNTDVFDNPLAERLFKTAETLANAEREVTEKVKVRKMTGRNNKHVNGKRQMVKRGFEFKNYEQASDYDDFEY